MRIITCLFLTLLAAGCGGTSDYTATGPQPSPTTTIKPPTASLQASLTGVPVIRTPVGQLPTATPPPGLAVSGARFTPLGTLPGGTDSEAYALSGNGSTVTGTSITASGSRLPFKWSEASGMVALPLTEHYPGGEGHALSENGDVVGGLGIFYDLLAAQEWTGTGVLPVPGTIPGPYQAQPLIVTALSQDGRIAVGTAGSGIIGYQAFRWTTGDANPTGLGYLGGSGTSASSLAAGAAPDAAIVTGISTTSDNTASGFRWTAASGMTPLPTLSGQRGNYGWAVSSDGQVIVGWSYPSDSMSERPFPLQATRWTASGAVSLGQLAGFTLTSQAYATSSDGSVVVGTASSADSFQAQTAFIWDSRNGMRRLQDVLGTAVPEGWNLLVATGISNNGKAFGGFAINPSGAVEAFHARLP